MKNSVYPATTILPPRLPNPAVRALHHAGYKRLDQLTKVTEAEIAVLHGIGPGTIIQLREALAERGLRFATRVNH